MHLIQLSTKQDKKKYPSYLPNGFRNWAWRHTTIITALGRGEQQEDQEFKARLSYINLKKKKKGFREATEMAPW